MTDAMPHTTQKIRQFITTNFYAASAGELADDASLLDNGIIDSTGVLEVIAFLERSFAIQVEDAEMVPENLDSIARIAAFVSRKGGAAARAHSSSGQVV